MAVVAAAIVVAGEMFRALPGTAQAQTNDANCPWLNSSQPISQRVAELMSQMSLADEDVIVHGVGPLNDEGPTPPASDPYVFYMPGISTLCIPPLGEEDGPAGVADGLIGVTQLPAGVGLAATFDPSLARQYGQVIGTEEWGKGADVNLGPTINIDRDPRWGRSFETFTEDPFLNASLATSEIEGVQSTGEMSQVKHFAAYNQETNRNTPADDVIVDQRTLNEIYYPAFQAAIQQAKAGSIMCAYSTINGNYACQNQDLLTNVLKQEWDFPGFVTSDYGALHSTTGGAFAGLDEEQPFFTYYGPGPGALEQDVENGTIPQAVINTMVQRILTQMFQFNLFNNPPTGTPQTPVTTPAHQAVGTDVADTAATLLKNKPHTLPLSANNAGDVAVIGPAASTQPIYGGGGSAYVVPSSTVTPLAGLEAAAGPRTHITYEPGLPTDTSLAAIPSSNLTPGYAATPFGGSYSGTLTAPETGTYVLAITNDCGCYTPTYLSLNGTQLIDDPSTPPVHTYSVAVSLTAGKQYTLSISGDSDALTWARPSDLAPGIAAAAAAAKSAKTAVVVVSDDTETEAADRLSLNLPSAQDELISAVAAANPHTVVVIDAGAPIAMPWLSQVSSVLDAWYPGQSNGTSLAKVLFGQVDPSGHLPVTFPTSLSEVPASTQAQFPGIVTNPTVPSGTVQYSEGIDVGYRWYDAKDLKPLFPFGFGLSYTRFAFTGLRVDRSAVNGVDDVHVSATVTNIGTTAGADVAQIYLGDPQKTGEPPRELVGFQRVQLDPGRSARVQFTITPRDEWWWDDNAGGWTSTRGLYRVYVGDSSALANLPLRDAFGVTETPGARQVYVNAPSSMTPGQPSRVTVTLSSGGDETLHNVRLALQLPDGWTMHSRGKTVFGHVKPRKAVATTFVVTPPSYAPSTNSVVHATADLGPDAQREAGVTVTVS